MSNTSRNSPANVSALEIHLGYWLRFVSNHVSHSFKVKLERHGVTVAEWVVLRALFDESGIKPSAISEKIGLTRGAVSKLLDRLASKSLVAIRADAADGRAQVITLTASGRRLVPRLAALADQNDAETFEHLDDEQRAALLSILKSIVERLDLRAVPID
ncbi:MAG: MarR family transcriptional regulator [Acidobacteria bacterium]|nr:MarR family transcriptional regulator [Acidobacteriota bacterium]